MIGGHYFRQLRRRPSPRAPRTPRAQRRLQSLLAHDVLERFARLGGADLTAIVLDPSARENAEDSPANPGHPACAQHAGSDYCRESWQLHLAELRSRPETHWHKCDYGRLCAMVPIVCQDRCLAVIKIASPASMAEEDFARQVELLDVLAREFVTRNSDFLGRLSLAHAAAADSGAAGLEGAGEYFERKPSHPRIVKAIRAIEQQLADPKLTVGRIAGQLGMNPSYLGHLFVDQVGQRMSRFIAARRMELAKHLLATTDWQIKRIAGETGHANPNWFCYVFRVFTGLAPGAFRRRYRDPSRAVRKR